MDEQIKPVLDHAREQMEGSIEHFQKELTSIRAGKASPLMLDGLMVDYYGTDTPIAQVASVTASDARTLLIQPWEKKMLQVIEKKILQSNLGFTPSNDGEMIRISIPSLTEERRKQLVKQAKGEGENAKVSIRNARQDANHRLKKLKNESVSEDNIKEGEKLVQDLTNKYSNKVEEILGKKEEEIMTV
ncbi:MAG: ribosome recycling factor [Bacteroidota bacterium]